MLQKKLTKLVPLAPASERETGPGQVERVAAECPCWGLERIEEYLGPVILYFCLKARRENLTEPGGGTRKPHFQTTFGKFIPLPMTYPVSAISPLKGHQRNPMILSHF